VKTRPAFLSQELFMKMVIFATRLRLIWQPQSCGNPIETLYKETEMKRQANEISAGWAHEDAHDLAAYLFDELPLSEQEASDIRAGFDLTNTPQPPTPCLGCDWGPPVTNHNETLAEDEADLDQFIEQLTDLEPNCEITGGSIGAGALVNLSGTNTHQRTTTVTERESKLVYSGEPG
jgi:hypothetical protein